MFYQGYVEFNGVEHFVVEYEAKESEKKPVVLYVHGGPGLAETLMIWEVQLRTKEETNLVFYDQRGAGRTFYKSPDGLVDEESIEADLSAAVDYVYNKFNRKIVLMAHNFGTLPAIRYVQKHPEKILCYVGYEQISNMQIINAVRFARVRELAEKSRKRFDVKKVDKYSALTGGTFDKTKLTKHQVTNCNVLLERYHVASGTDKRLMKSLPTSPIYSMDDLRALLNAPRLSYKLTEYFKQVNLLEESMEFQVPIGFISGDWDYQYPFKMSEEYLEQITAPDKKMMLLKDLDSNAMWDDGDLFWNEVMDFVYKYHKELQSLDNPINEEQETEGEE